MKATLTFNLPEEEVEFDLSKNGPRFNLVISCYLEWLRQKIKYSNVSEEELKSFEEARKYLFDLLDEYNLKDVY